MAEAKRVVDKPLNIHQRIAEVMKQIAYVKKDKEVGSGSGKYMAVTHDNIIAAIRPYLLDHGITFSVSLVSGQMVDTGKKTAAGTPIFRYDGVFNATFYNIDDPTDCLPECIPASGDDTGDKAAGKAVTYAKKTALVTVFLIETGIEDESRTAAAGEGPVKPTLNANDLRDYLAEIGKAGDEAALQVWLKTARKSIVDVAGEYKGHPDWVKIMEAASKRKGELAGAA